MNLSDTESSSEQSVNYMELFEKMNSEEKLAQINKDANLMGSTLRLMLAKFKSFEDKITSLSQENKRQKDISNLLLDTLKQASEKE